jgi:uncharacterized protein (TIGR02996 family)
MSRDHAALIAAIHATPDDDMLRLACADWFEERGDPASVARADFIRTQIERVTLPDDDRRQSELEARELRLLKHWAAVWCGSHFVYKKVRFRRGFIEAVHLHLQHFQHHRRQMFALEPVREVCLTGWYRANDDLVRRVAGCEELSYIETLRLHHQGPHKAPRSNALILLESPHLTGVKTLHCPGAQFDADARRRFERLPVLRQVEVLGFPYLGTFPLNPGDWFSDGGIEAAGKWENLRSLTLPPYPANLVQQFMGGSFWNNLTTLSCSIGLDRDLVLLRDRLPPGLKELNWGVWHSPVDLPSLDSFLERLRTLPLERLDLSGMPITPAALRSLLDDSDRVRLKRLRLSNYQVGPEHARVIAAAPGASRLRELFLGGGQEFREDAAAALFASEGLRSLVSLDLARTRIGGMGIRALAGAAGWDRLRSLKLGGRGEVQAEDLRHLLSAPLAQTLTRLYLSESPYQRDKPLAFTPEVARQMAELPHLAYLRLFLAECDPECRRLLADNEKLAWVLIYSAKEYDIHNLRNLCGADRSPSLDGDMVSPSEY